MNDDDFSKSVRFFKKVRNNPVTVMVMAVSGIVAYKGLIWKPFNYVVFLGSAYRCHYLYRDTYHQIYLPAIHAQISDYRVSSTLAILCCVSLL